MAIEPGVDPPTFEGLVPDTLGPERLRGQR